MRTATDSTHTCSLAGAHRAFDSRPGWSTRPRHHRCEQWCTHCTLVLCALCGPALPLARSVDGLGAALSDAPLPLLVGTSQTCFCCRLLVDHPCHVIGVCGIGGNDVQRPMVWTRLTGPADGRTFRVEVPAALTLCHQLLTTLDGLSLRIALPTSTAISYSLWRRTDTLHCCFGPLCC